MIDEKEEITFQVEGFDINHPSMVVHVTDEVYFAFMERMEVLDQELH